MPPCTAFASPCTVQEDAEDTSDRGVAIMGSIVPCLYIREVHGTKE